LKGNGHLEPLIPLAHATRAAGHTVAFSGHVEAISPVFEALGFTLLGREPGAGQRPLPLRPLVPFTQEKADREVRDGFARTARSRAATLLGSCDRFQPDLLVCEELDFGGMVAAEALGLPHASVLVSAPGFVRRELVATALNELRVEHGLSPDPELEMLSRYLVLSPLAPSYRDSESPLPATAHSFSSQWSSLAKDLDAPAWMRNLGDATTIYLSLGTFFNLFTGDLFPRLVEGLRDLPVNLIITTGPNVAPQILGRQPANVHIEPFIPHAVVLPRCRLVVCHAGLGTVTHSLAHGLPMVLLPLAADHTRTAARCQELNVARVLDPILVTPQAAREATANLLADAAAQLAAQRIRDEIAALPGPAEMVKLLERLVAEKRPVLSR
jgi:UDP:flavonoid glycosyltransferase YjiC (YdhE family)